MRHPSREIQARVLVTVFLFLISGIASFATDRIQVSAQTQPEMSVLNPLTGNSNFVFYTDTTAVGFKLNATLWASGYGTPPAYAWQVRLNYNATILTTTRAWIVPGSDPDYIFFGQPTLRPPPSFADSSVLVGDTSLNSSVSSATPKKLGIIEFQIILAPSTGNTLSSSLDISNVDTYLLDDNLTEIATTKANGYYAYNWVAPSSLLEVKPNAHITLELETFNVEVWLEKIQTSQRLIGVQFWLHYNATLLNVANVTEGLFLNQFQNAQTAPYTYFTYEIENHTVKVGILILPNATVGGGEWSVFPQGNGTLATITFQGVYQGSYPEANNSTLALTHITLLSDSMSEIRMLPPINGFYQILARGPSMISLAANPATIEFGSNTTLGGVITPTSEGANVTIYRRSGTEDWAQLTVVKANATGGYAYNWTPEMSGSFELKANWAGDATTLAAESSVTTLTVNKVGSEISLNVDPSSVVLGGDATITGSISPRHTGVNVTISYRLTGEQWSELTMTKTDSNSQYAFTWNTFRVGTFEIKASWLGDENTLPAESSISSLTVNKVASEISLNVNPQNVTFGSDVTMSGAISPERTGVNVAISYRPAGGQWSELAIVETDSNGLYAFTWKPLQTGRFEFKANWSGDENTLQTESDVRSVTVEGQSNVFLYVVVAVIGIIAAALILYYWRTRKSKQGTGQT